MPIREQEGQNEEPEPQLAPVHLLPSADVSAVSVVIPLYNSWSTAIRCLESVRRQRLAPLEVIVVDDGSEIPASTEFRKAAKAEMIKLIRIGHSGVSAARNRGLDLARAPLVLFVDSDCYLDVRAVERLATAAVQRPHDNTFQLRISGDIAGLIGTAEHIYNAAAQDVFRESDGSMSWLNTAGFAVRRAYAEKRKPLFNETAIRGQDTLLLAELMKEGRLPRWVPESVVFHSPPLSLFRYVCMAYEEQVNSRLAYALIKEMNVPVRANSDQRRRMLLRLWSHASEVRQGALAFALIAVRHLIKATARRLAPEAGSRYFNFN